MHWENGGKLHGVREVQVPTQCTKGCRGDRPYDEMERVGNTKEASVGEVPIHGEVAVG